MAGGTRTAGGVAAAGWNPLGVLWLAVAVLAALPLFGFGLAGLAAAWTRPEYSHGPVIPLLSFYMFLHEMKAVPPAAGTPAGNRWPGVAVIGLALVMALVGNLVQINDLVFYALIVWVFGLVLVGFGARRGPGLLAVGAAPRLHAAAAAVPLLAGPHRAAVRLLGGRRGAGARHGGAGLPRGQRHRPRGLQAAGRRGLLGAALPVPDHELHLRLRRALPRAGLAQAGAAPRRRCRSRS